MMVTLRQPLNLAECQQVRLWRNAPDVLPMLRTRAPLTEAQQTAFYYNTICDPESQHRYYAIETKLHINRTKFVGMGGLTYLHREPGQGEISLILGPEFRGYGFGDAAVDALIEEAWRIGLTSVIGEVYEENPARRFWWRMLEKHVPTSRSWKWEKRCSVST